MDEEDSKAAIDRPWTRPRLLNTPYICKRPAIFTETFTGTATAIIRNFPNSPAGSGSFAR